MKIIIIAVFIFTSSIVNAQVILSKTIFLFDTCELKDPVIIDTWTRVDEDRLLFIKESENSNSKNVFDTSTFLYLPFTFLNIIMLCEGEYDSKVFKYNKNKDILQKCYLFEVENNKNKINPVLRTKKFLLTFIEANALKDCFKPYSFSNNEKLPNGYIPCLTPFN